ncbi:hypothetical protein BDM02DRAFT_3153219 [Thelephora ganbajun]|uniref:Uncharacterized protein n=1 Tax=Thelephora ganbajun TaxID=370292 RepID=A0ACB6ZUW7_THEGA|nr:hypothetical protein BDM02DRAFT_3153219 [Thelephora ganbajun]
MSLPSSREIELETLLRQRDAQVLELTDEISHLRQYLSTQPGPSATDPISLPPALISYLLPHLASANKTPGTGPTTSTSGSSSSTVTAALVQRTKLLQEENDELYELLKSGETGKLKEEVRGLRKVVDRLERALKESHQVIASLSNELDKAYDVINTSNSRSTNSNYHPHSPSKMRNGISPRPPAGSGSNKPPPTGPRAHKKPRLSQSPSTSTTSLHPHSYSRKNVGLRARSHDDRVHDRDSVERKVPQSVVKMEVDEDESHESRRSRRRSRSRSRSRSRDRERERDKGRHRGRTGGRETDRERDWDTRERERESNRLHRPGGHRESGTRRNGGGSGGVDRGRGGEVAVMRSSELATSSHESLPGSNTQDSRQKGQRSEDSRKEEKTR